MVSGAAASKSHLTRNRREEPVQFENRSLNEPRVSQSASLHSAEELCPVFAAAACLRDTRPRRGRFANRPFEATSSRDATDRLCKRYPTDPRQELLPMSRAG